MLGLYGFGKEELDAAPPLKKDPTANTGSYGGGPLDGEEIHPDLATGR